MKALSVSGAVVALVVATAWGIGCVQTCPSSGCGADQRCQHTVDTGTFCCGAPGTAPGGCCYPPDGGSVCSCIADYGMTECTTDADCCSGHCAKVSGKPTARGHCLLPDGGTP